MDEAHTALLVAAGILLVYFLLSLLRTRVNIVHAEVPALVPTGRNGKLAPLSDLVSPEACPALHRFRPTPWLLSGHLQTYYASGFTYRDEDLVHYERDTIRMPDGGTVTQDWSPRIPATLEEAVKPVVFITHGLTGGSHESYVMSLVRYVVDDLDMFAVVQNFRGCAETELTSPICYNGGWTGDLALGIEHARRRILDVRRQHGSDESAIVMAGVGFSLGANIMAKFVGETGPACPLTCHISVANPADLLAGSRHLESSFFLKNVYSRIMGGNLITMLKRHIHHFHEAQYPFVDLPRVVASKSILEFDDRFTAPLFGFASAAEYYRYASSANFVHTISIPTVFVHALDDPVAPMSSLPILEITKNPYLSLVWTQHGGHLGFFRGLFRPHRWSTDAVAQLLHVLIPQQRGPGELGRAPGDTVIPVQARSAWERSQSRERMGLPSTYGEAELAELRIRASPWKEDSAHVVMARARSPTWLLPSEANRREVLAPSPMPPLSERFKEDLALAIVGAKKLSSKSGRPANAAIAAVDVAPVPLKSASLFPLESASKRRREGRPPSAAEMVGTTLTVSMLGILLFHLREALK